MAWGLVVPFVTLAFATLAPSASAELICVEGAGPEVCAFVVEPPDHLLCVYVDGEERLCIPLASCGNVAGRSVCYGLFQPHCDLYLSAGFGGCFV